MIFDSASVSVMRDPGNARKKRICAPAPAVTESSWSLQGTLSRVKQKKRQKPLSASVALVPGNAVSIHPAQEISPENFFPEVSDGGLQAFAQGHLRFPAQPAAGPRDVRPPLLGVVLGQRTKRHPAA